MSAISKKIYNKLGGKEFVLITGANNFSHHESAIAFKYGRDNLATIKANNDTYTMILIEYVSKGNRMRTSTRHEIENISPENLAGVFRNMASL